MKNTLKTAFVLMTVSAMALTACSPFHPSKEMAGSAAIEKSIEGLEKLDDRKTAQFLQAVGKKYAGGIKDLSAAVDAKTVLSVDLEELLAGTDFDITVGVSAAEFAVDQDKNMKYTDLSLKLGIPVLGDISLKCDGYNDAAEHCTYTYMKDFSMGGGLFSLAGDSADFSDDLNQWTRKKEEKDPGAETESGDTGKEKDKKEFSLDPQRVCGIYVNKNNGSYIVDVSPEIVNDLQDLGSISGTENTKCLVTFDKGIALTGLWIGADSFHVKADGKDETEFDVKNLDMTVDFLTINSGFDAKVPEDVKAAAVDDSGDEESPMDLIENLL